MAVPAGLVVALPVPLAEVVATAGGELVLPSAGELVSVVCAGEPVGADTVGPPVGFKPVVTPADVSVAPGEVPGVPLPPSDEVGSVFVGPTVVLTG